MDLFTAFSTNVLLLPYHFCMLIYNCMGFIMTMYMSYKALRIMWPFMHLMYNFMLNFYNTKLIVCYEKAVAYYNEYYNPSPKFIPIEYPKQVVRPEPPVTEPVPVVKSNPWQIDIPEITGNTETRILFQKTKVISPGPILPEFPANEPYMYNAQGEIQPMPKEPIKTEPGTYTCKIVSDIKHPSWDLRLYPDDNNTMVERDDISKKYNDKCNEFNEFSKMKIHNS